MTGRETREPAWLCFSCGYMMDMVSHLTEDVAPSDGDVTICLNCAAPYCRDGGKWRPFHSGELEALPLELRQRIKVYQTAQRMAVRTDLAERSGRA